MAQNASGQTARELLAKGQRDEAIRVLHQTLDANPQNADARVLLGLALIESGDYAAARAQLDYALRTLGHRPDAAYALYLRAKADTALDQVRTARTDLQQAVSIQPRFAEAWSDLGEARKTLLDEAGALAAFEKAVQCAPNDPVAQTRVGSELLDQGRARDALPHLDQAARLDPENQSALYNLQRALGEDGHPRQAQAVRQALAELLRKKDREAQNAFAAIQLNDQGAALEKAGKLREALEKYREAVNLDPEHAGIRVNYAAALLHLGQWKEGVRELREASRLDPDNLAIKKALEEVLAHPIPGEP